MNTFPARLALCGLLALTAAPAIFAADAAPAAAPAEDKPAPAVQPAGQSATPSESTPPAAAPEQTGNAPAAEPPAESVAPAPDLQAEVTDLKRQLAEAEDKLSTALHSYTLLQNESDQAKTDADKRIQESEAASAKALAAAQADAARAAADSAARITALSDELRQTQAQAMALAAQVADLKTRLAISGPAPGSSLAVPQRPAPMAAPAAMSPASSPSAPGDTPPAADAAGPRHHVVAAGDTLAKISQRYYGTANRWNEIFAANRNILQNENRLPIGASLLIP
jgi:nucleoid-associated protein YgaU